MQPFNSPSASAGALRATRPGGAHLARPTIAIVNVGPRALERFESMPEFDGYDLLILDSRTGAYGDIKRLRPSLVVVAAALETDACQLLTILKLDEETHHIPVVTIATDPADRDAVYLESPLLIAARN
jgi:CheY-like chemotaxis protein